MVKKLKGVDGFGRALLALALVFSGVSPASAAAPTTISAELRSFNTLGLGTVSSGFPLRPGDVTDAMLQQDQVCVFVNGVEQRTYIEALRGRFTDGSIRSLLIQFSYNIPSSAGIPGQLRLGTSCSKVHIAKTAVSSTVYLDARVFLPTDPLFLSETWVTFQPMLPASQEDPASASYFTTFFDRRFETKFPTPNASTGVLGKYDQLTAGNYQSTYESTRSLFAAWQKTGDSKYFYNAYQRAYYLLTAYSLPLKGSGFYNPDPNPNGLPGVAANGRPPEWHSQRFLSYGVAYLLTGLEEFWNVVCIEASAQLGTKTTQALAQDPDNGWIDDNYVGRFNIRTAWAAGLTVVIDATKPFSGTYGGVAPYTNFGQRLTWILDTWELYAYKKGDFRDGLVGNRDSATDGGQTAPGDLPLFQVALLGDFLIFYYTNVHADPRIPAWVQKMADIVLGEIAPLQAGDTCYGQGQQYGYNYLLTAGQGRTGKLDPYTLPMWSTVLAFTYAMTNNPTYLNGYRIVSDPINVDPNCLNWSWKIWGESFGNVMSAPYYINRGLPPGLPPAIRQPLPPTTPPVVSGPPTGAASVPAWTPRVFPNPWRADRHTNRSITFDQLPNNSVIKIFTTSGHLVRELDVPTGSVTWMMDNGAGKPVASGIYLYVATDGQGGLARGKFAVIR